MYRREIGKVDIFAEMRLGIRSPSERAEWERGVGQPDHRVDGEL